MSNMKFAQEIENYSDAERFLAGKERRRLTYKTDVVRISDEAIGVMHHRTVIVTYVKDGSIVLDNGGWDSATTSNRMHRLTPANVRAFIRDFAMRLQVDDGAVLDLDRRMVIQP